MGPSQAGLSSESSDCGFQPVEIIDQRENYESPRVEARTLNVRIRHKIRLEALREGWQSAVMKCSGARHDPSLRTDNTPLLSAEALTGFWARALRLALAATIVATPLGWFAYLETPLDSQSATFILGVCLCGALRAAGLRTRGGWTPITPLWRLALGVFAVSLAISIARAADPLYALSRSLLPAAGIVFFLAAAGAMRTAGDLDRLSALWTIVGVCLAAIAVLQAAGLLRGAEGVEGKTSVFLPFGHPNHLASALAPIVFLTLVWGRAGGGMAGRLRSGALVILGMGLMVTGTRGAWLAVLAGSGVYGVLLARAGRLGRRAFLSFALVMAGVLLLALPFVIPNRFIPSRFDLRERLVSESEARSRLYSWLIAADMFQEHPIVGNGIGAYEAGFWDAVSRRQAGPSGRWFETTVIRMNRVPPQHPHNEFLSLAAEQGLLGVFAGALIVACGLVVAWRLTGSMGVCERSPAALEDARGGEQGATTAIVAAALGAGVIASLVDACFMFPFHLPASLAAYVFLLASLARLGSPTDR